MISSRLLQLSAVLFLGNLSSELIGGTPGSEEELIHSYVAELSLSAKIGQMIQAEVLNIQSAMAENESPIRDLGLGSVLAGGNSIISPNTPDAWYRELNRLQDEARQSSAGWPLLVGVDAVHGHGLVRGATVFPHNIGLGATRDPELLRKIGSAVAQEVLETGFNWTFAPAVSVARDVRWGRTYESFGETAELQTLLTESFVRGLQETMVGEQSMAATAKHFLGDGGTVWGTGYVVSDQAGIDRGDTQGDPFQLIAMHGEGFRKAVQAGIDTIMVSYSSFNGVKMHSHRLLIRSYLKGPKILGGLGFDGFVISDWNAIDELPSEITDPVERYQGQLIEAVQSGIDMIMVEGRLALDTSGEEDTQFRYARVHQLLMEAVQEGRLPQSRIDDAVTRIIRVKMRNGLLPAIPAQTLFGKPDKPLFGHPSHRELAREAVRKSLVLLKNEAQTLPITAAKYRALCVAGSKADDFGVQAGGWTTGWQGTTGNASKTTGANTILDGLRAAARAQGLRFVYSRYGIFLHPSCWSRESLHLVVVGEKPYAEFFGDSDNLTLPAEDLALLRRVQLLPGRLAVVLISGRPMIITPQLDQWQALVAAWLPGSQGEGVADGLFGEYEFTGRLSLTWPADHEQLAAGEHEGLFPYGFGLQMFPAQE